MNALDHIRSLMEVTSRDVAQRRAKARLNSNPQDLIREIERDIARQVGDMYVAARGGEYTPEVVASVTELYRGMGWHVQFNGYWLMLD